MLSSLIILTYGLKSLVELDSVIAIALLLFFAVTLFKKEKPLVVALAFGTSLILALSFFVELWPIPSFVSSLLLAVYLVRRKQLDWWGEFSLKTQPVVVSCLFGVLSVLLVIGWSYLIGLDTDQVPFQIPQNSNAVVVVLLIIGFALFNSFAEEFLFRGLALISTEGLAPLIANLIQSMAFGLLHFKGFPYGVSGALLAGGFAFLQGLLRLKYKSLAYPIIAHFIANIGMGLYLWYFIYF